MDDTTPGRGPRRTSRHFSLAGQLFSLQLILVVVALLAGGLFWLHHTRIQLDRQYAQRVLAIAESVATLPTVRDALREPDPARTIAPLAERIRRATDASFIVVANDRQIRYSHPDANKIGKRLSTDASAVLTGQPWTGVQRGTTGRSMRAKVPLLDATGRTTGVVSVGIPEASVANELWSALPEMAITTGALVTAGAGGTYLIARRTRRQTYGLAAEEIGTLLDHRVAMLHALKEGVLAFDSAGRITLVNDEARRLLDLPGEAEGRRLAELDLPERLDDVLAGRVEGPDEIVLRRGRVLVLNRMPVQVSGRQGGSVITLRDRTQLDQLARQLDGARMTTDTLRAQAHEFSNRIHTLSGLLELGEYEEARAFIAEISDAHSRFTEELTTRVRDPAIAALLLAKSAAAREQGARLNVAPDADLRPIADADARNDLLLVTGNLVDNALESLSGRNGSVLVSLRDTSANDRAAIAVEVTDSGPGVAPGIVDEVFRSGFTTKVAQQGGQRGLGLALVRQTCRARGGHVEVTNDDGAVFSALLPIPETSDRPDTAPRELR